MCALIDLDHRVLSDPETRKPRYWPITREQIDGANKSILFSERGGSDPDGHERKMIRASPLKIDQLNAAFNFPEPGFDPQVGSIQFGLQQPSALGLDPQVEAAEFGMQQPAVWVPIIDDRSEELEAASRVIADLFAAEGLDFDVYLQGGELLSYELMGHNGVSQFNCLVNELHISLTRLLELDPAERSEVLRHATGINFLVNEAHLLSLEQLVALDPDHPPLVERPELLQNPDNSARLLSLLGGLEQFLSLGLNLRSELLRNVYEASYLVSAGVDIQRLIDLDDPLRAEVLRNYYYVGQFVKGGNSFDAFIQADPEQRSVIIDNERVDSDRRMVVITPGL